MTTLRQLYMDCSTLLPLHGYSVRSDGNVNVSGKAIALCGGIDAMTRRIIGVYSGMPEHYRGVGQHWYDEAHEFAADLADVYGFTVWEIAQVIAVLSPQNPWNGKIDKKGHRWADGNRLCAINVIKAFCEGGAEHCAQLRGWGYHPDFINKAVRVLGGNELDWSKAPKTHRFALLIADPLLEDIAVCDSHSSRVASGNLGDRYHVVTLAAYGSVEEAYITAGAILGIPAYQAQAGTWQFAVDGHLYGTKEE